ncbi:MAG: hypothetical protein KatS3mg129_3216 [Leptospiraceae bacterium]|nr:MAG: hypothetical protein KatS3mg129_3216 [Leptospiraceae bacterium]
MKKLNHKHLNFKEKMYFLLGILDDNGNIIQQNIITRIEYQNIFEKINECSDCRKIAKIYFNYYLLNSEDTMLSPPYPKKNKIKLLPILLFLFLLFDFDYPLFNQTKNLQLILDNKIQQVVNNPDKIITIHIYKNKENIGFINIDPESKIIINNKKICKNESIKMIDGSLKIHLNKSIPFCLSIDDKTIIIKNNYYKNKMVLSITKNINENNEIEYEISISNGNSHILILPDYEEFQLNADEILEI